MHCRSSSVQHLLLSPDNYAGGNQHLRRVRLSSMSCLIFIEIQSLIRGPCLLPCINLLQRQENIAISFDVRAAVRAEGEPSKTRILIWFPFPISRGPIKSLSISNFQIPDFPFPTSCFSLPISRFSLDIRS